MFSKRLLLSALAVMLLAISGLPLVAMNTPAPVAQAPAYNYGYGYGYGYNPRKEQEHEFDREIKRLQTKKDVAQAKFDLCKKGDTDPEKIQLRGDLDDAIEELAHRTKDREGFKAAKKWDWLLKPLAGKDNLEYVQDAEPNGRLDAFKIALGAQAMGAVGSVINGRLKTAMDSTFGSLIDWLGRSTKNAFVDLGSYFFHDGMKPFDKSKLEAWSNMILDSLNNINAMVENGAGLGLRGMDMTSRQSEEDAANQPVSTADAKNLDAWTEFATIHAEEYRYFIEHMQKTKEYYEEGDVVIFYVDKICQMLAVMYKLLTETTSFKDFTNKLSSNKMMVKAMSSYLKNYFQYLYKEVCVRAGDEQGAKNAASIGGSGGYRGIGGGYDAGYNNGAFSGAPVY